MKTNSVNAQFMSARYIEDTKRMGFSSPFIRTVYTHLKNGKTEKVVLQGLSVHHPFPPQEKLLPHPHTHTVSNECHGLHVFALPPLSLTHHSDTEGAASRHVCPQLQREDEQALREATAGKDQRSQLSGVRFATITSPRTLWSTDSADVTVGRLTAVVTVKCVQETMWPHLIFAVKRGADVQVSHLLKSTNVVKIWPWVRLPIASQMCDPKSVT